MEDNIHLPHPLTIDLVVPVVLRHVTSIQNLVAFRQVCRIWREFATPVISSSLELPLINFKEEGSEAAGDAGKSLLPKYIDYLEMDFHPKIIFSNFHFDGISMDHPIVQRFLEEFGRIVKKLYLNKIDRDFYAEKRPFQDYEGDEDTQETQEEETPSPLKFRRLLLSCPNLEELVLGCDREEIGLYGFLRKNDDFKTKIKKVAWIPFAGFEYLKPDYQFIYDLRKVCSSGCRMINAQDLGPGFTKALSQSPYVSSLKELEIMHNGYAFRRLRHAEFQKLKLTKLRFRDIEISQAKEFCRFLDTQKSSLEALIIGSWQLDVYGRDLDAFEPSRIQFPDVMEKLHVLSIGGYNGSGRFQRLSLQPLDFQRQFPVLRTLIFRGFGEEAQGHDLNAWFAPEMAPQSVLEELELPRGIKTPVLRMFARLFPNVKALQLQNVDENLLRVLWEQWPRIESFTLYDMDNIEVVLTGLSTEQISIVDSLIKEKKEIEITAENSSILRFQNLKELRILIGNVEAKATRYLTDLSIHSTLSKLPKLEFLAVSFQKFTEEGIHHLCNARGLKRIQNENWVFQLCQKDLQEENKYYGPAWNKFENYQTTWGQ